MIRVLGCEFRKCTRSIAIYICMLVMLLVPLVEYLFLVVSSKSSGLSEAAQQMIDTFLAANGDELFVYLYNLLFNGGCLFVVATVMAAIIVAEDYSRGTMKYVMLLSSRTKLGFGKVGILLIIATLLHFVGMIVPVLISKGVRDIFYGQYTLEQLVYYVLIGWSTITAFTLLVGVIGTLTKNVPATIGIGLGIYMLGAGFGMHLPETVQKYLFIMNISKIGSTDIDDMFFAVIVSCVTLVLFSLFLWYDLKKKEY
ncbi:MAG: ABC transporter permease [Lachnospiraceae bacterium]|nr:ABC transporter permease [Lachnospiraceae bacterium]